MRIKGEIRCFNCGRLLAEVVGGYPHFQPIISMSCPTGKICLTHKASGALGCAYCGGWPILEEEELVAVEVA